MSRDLGYLLDIVNNARLARQFTAGTERATLENDLMRQYAVVRTLEIVGEAARRISPDFQNAHPEIPWGKMIGMRNRLIHQYGEVDLDIVWDVVANELPELIAQLDPLIPPEGEDNGLENNA